jgi:hypothetical protein
MDLLYLAALAAVIGLALAFVRFRTWRRRHRHHAHPVTLSARLGPVACRCPDGPCRIHPFAFDYERLLAAPHAPR